MTNLTIDHLTALLDFQHNATPAEFKQVFGNLGDHLWGKFEQCDCNLLTLYSRMDDRNAQRLIDHLNQQSRPPEHSVIADLPERHEMEQYGI